MWTGQEKVQWRDLVDTVMKLLSSIKSGEIFTTSATISFS